MTLPGFTVPGGPVVKKELRQAWMKVYIVLMMLKSHNPAEREKLSKMQDDLAQLNETVTEVLDDD